MLLSKILYLIFEIYIKKRKKQVILHVCTVINGLFEILTINLALPFLSILTETANYLITLFQKLYQKFLIFP